MRHDQAKSNSAGETWAPPVRSATSGDPAFNEPWEAQAFALAATLSARGCYTWSEWSSELAEQLRVPEKTDGGDRNGYYLCWLMTLEKLAVAKGLMHIAANLIRIDNIGNLARIAGMNNSAFSRSFRSHTGMTPIKYLTRLRINLACGLLMSDVDKSITDIAFDVGFNNLSNFNRQFLSLKGMAPSRFRHLHFSSKGASLSDAFPDLRNRRLPADRAPSLTVNS